MTNDNVTFVNISSTELEFASVEEFVDTIAESRFLKTRFSFEVIGEVAAEDMVPVLGQGENKIEGYIYDTSLYIPRFVACQSLFLPTAPGPSRNRRSFSEIPQLHPPAVSGLPHRDGAPFPGTIPPARSSHPTR